MIAVIDPVPSGQSCPWCYQRLFLDRTHFCWGGSITVYGMTSDISHRGTSNDGSTASTELKILVDEFHEGLSKHEMEKGHGVGHRMTPRKRSKCRRHKRMNCNVPGC